MAYGKLLSQGSLSDSSRFLNLIFWDSANRDYFIPIPPEWC